MRVMISQPRYLPNVSYMKRISMCDMFIVYDNVQRGKRIFENRNKLIDTNGNPQWLTIPIKSSSRSMINETEINGMSWKEEHINKVMNWYAKDKELINIYKEYLSKFDNEDYCRGLTNSLCFLLDKLEINTQVIYASSLYTQSTGIDKLIEMTKIVGGTHYVSGKMCLEYGLDETYAKNKGVNLIIDQIPNENYSWLHSLHKKEISIK